MFVLVLLIIGPEQPLLRPASSLCISERERFLFFLRRSFALVTQAGVQWHDLSSLNLHLLGSSDSPASASQVAGTAGSHHHTQLNFVVLVEMRFHHVDQDGLDLLTL